MKTWIALLTLLLALPAVAPAAGPTGLSVLLPETAAEPGGDDPAARSWTGADLFYVRSHTCRTTPVAGVCGPDPLINAGASFTAIARVRSPLAGSYNVYAFIADVEGGVVAFGTGTFAFGTNTYHDVVTTFPPVADGVYKLIGLAFGATNGKIAFAPTSYVFRVGAANSGGCCP